MQRSDHTTQASQSPTLIKNKITLPIFLFFTLLIVSTRIITIFSIEPANAPDENGHLYIVNNAAHGHFVSVENEIKNSKYPYSLYNPLPYLPSILSLKIANLFDPSILDLKGLDSEVAQEYDAKNVYAARIGQMFWNILFFIFFAKFLIELLHWLEIKNQKQFQVGFFLAFLFVCSLPQLLFLQSYVNLDNMGVTASFYHLWSILSLNPVHFAISFFLLLNSKLNFICLFSISFLFLFYLWRQNKLTKKWIISITIASICALWWSGTLLTFQKMGFKSLLGFKLLPELFKDFAPAIIQATFKNFILISFLSSYGVFAWMTQYMPRYFYLFFASILILGSVGLFYFFNQAKIKFLNKQASDAENKNVFYFLIGVLSIIASNVILHFLAGIGHSFQPQGRYLLPSTILFYTFGWFYFAFKWVEFDKSKNLVATQMLFILLTLFSMFELKTAIASAKENLFLAGYGYSNYKLVQDSSNEKTKELLAGDEIKQSFELAEPIQKVYLRISSFQRANDAQGIVKISDCSTNIYFENQIEFNELKTIGDFKIIDFDAPKNFASTHLCLILKLTKGEAGHSIALQKSFAGTTQVGQLTLNNQLIPGDLVFKIY